MIFATRGLAPESKLLCGMSKMKEISAKRGDLFGFLLIFAMSLINKCIYGVQKNKVYSCTHEEN